MSGDIRMCIAILCCVLSVVNVSRVTTSLQAIPDLINLYNRQAGNVFHEYEEANWNYVTNKTSYNQEIMLNKSMIRDNFRVTFSRKASNYTQSIYYPNYYRALLNIIKYQDTPISYDETKLAQMNKLVNDMAAIYSKALVCMNSTFCLPINPSARALITLHRGYDKLVEAWTFWRNVSGEKMKSLYSEFVNVSNDIVKTQGYADTGDFWRSFYEIPTFEDDVRALLKQLLPLYEQLHAYARRKLKAIYGNHKFPLSGHIPAHILGSMWAENWTALTMELSPFPSKPIFDVTDEMVRQNFTAKRIFETADDFFKSLGMRPMPPEFWKKSILEKPTDGREVECRPLAFDFYNGKDFRIKLCTAINMVHLVIAHQKMAQIQYSMHYASQPVVFQSSAYPGFSDAVADVISLSVKTPQHMNRIGLMETLSNDKETDLNFLMLMALQKLAFIPFGYLNDQWRWKVYRGEVTPDKYNEEWWNLRCRYQGVSPLVERPYEDFDPGASYHVTRNVPHIKYFVSNIVQFHLFKELCVASGYRGPLHKCDIYNSTTAGKILSNKLELGSSMHPKDIIKMDARPLMEYFKPLMDYLAKENGNDYGWRPHCLPTLSPTPAPTSKPTLSSVIRVSSNNTFISSHVLNFHIHSKKVRLNMNVSRSPSVNP